MLTLRNAYIALMLIAGVALGIAVSIRPELAGAVVPPILALLMVSLIIDVTIMAVAAKQHAMPLTTNARILGFFGAATLYLAITYFMTAL